MLSTITSCAVYGVTSYLVSVETDISQGMPYFDLVGYPGSEVREAKERVRVALRNSGVVLPAMRITVNLSPADIRKEGTALDLPIAIGIATSLGYLHKEQTKQLVIIGELGLGGEIKPVGGILPMVMEAKERGYTQCIVPYENREEGAVVTGIEVTGVSHLKQLFTYLKTEEAKRKEVIAPCTADAETLLRRSETETEIDFAEVAGQENAKRAVEIAAAGSHNLLLLGPPGCGKTMLARRIPTVLPPLTIEESLEVSKIYSVSGLLRPTQSLIGARPFLNPHHTISVRALTGGGRIPKPGVLSLAHRGVLFLDELPEFGRVSLDSMRQPLEDKVIHIARTQGNCVYPADFMLVCAMNPCPCGYYPDLGKCRCTPYEVRRYLNRISGPFLDRMDLCVEMEKNEFRMSGGQTQGRSSADMRERIAKVREIQKERYAGTDIMSNAQLTPGLLPRYAMLEAEEAEYMQRICRLMDISVRVCHRIWKVARTIADMEGSERILRTHIDEALCYRGIDEAYWKQKKEGAVYV